MELRTHSAEAAVEIGSTRFLRVLATSLLFFSLSAYGQQPSDSQQVPGNFTLDMRTAARLRAELLAQSVPASGRYATGRLVFERLLAQAPLSSGPRFAWQLRIAEDGELNAYASPDGTVYVESGLAQLAGASTGLWAAILSHEISHVVRRDWARRYLYQRSLESSGATIVLDDPGLPSASWADSEKLSADMGRFCRQLEIDADRDGLMLMARAGYHPDFMPALHHLLHARTSGTPAKSLYSMHPCWEERDRELSRAYVDASLEFERLWPAWYESPGGNPPVVVFAEEPTLKKVGAEWELQIPIRCQNLAGAVEVVVSSGPLRQNSEAHDPAVPAGANSARERPANEFRQLTGCISPGTTITFKLADIQRRSKSRVEWTDVYVLDGWGAVLARADVTRR
jgi:hypothetical protein